MRRIYGEQTDVSPYVKAAIDSFLQEELHRKNMYTFFFFLHATWTQSRPTRISVRPILAATSVQIPTSPRRVGDNKKTLQTCWLLYLFTIYAVCTVYNTVYYKTGGLNQVI